MWIHGCTGSGSPESVKITVLAPCGTFNTFTHGALLRSARSPPLLQRGFGCQSKAAFLISSLVLLFIYFFYNKLSFISFLFQ